ncbi:macrophage mannose receptor 1-like isoform X2 [Colossoma macropomum]|uniref:macrophage mannose receptor 1-like isoform X2 n=1 Tax=Colossoma macropomum TaxID=42526 RepID=UPI001863F7F5|nr:macrophage mannose receptor 1-like isoform X2 [Colossoma macropomum]
MDCLFHPSLLRDGPFLIYNARKNRCLGDNLRELFPCNPQSPRQQFRWTSENRIFNVEQKKCLGTGSKSEGNKLQWYFCDANNDLQKWECQNDTLFGLKNESLYLSLQGESNLVTLSRNPGDKGRWTIHGSMGSVCSRPYEEIYTIKGNAFGRPCQFPFRFKNKWYSDCTTEGSSNKRLWCAIESRYEAHELWGYCPTRQKDDNFWRKSPLTDVYYQLNEESALTWYQARKSCQQQGGDLLSVTEPHEQTFISGLTQQSGAVLWTGLNSLDASSGWHWVNGQPLRYLKWLSGQPSAAPGHSCGVASQLHGSEWSTAVCSERHGYICQKRLLTPTVPPVVHTGSCYSPWIPYSGHCYLLTRTKKTWLEARDACRREGGDLLSVLSVEEQSFAISQLGYLKTDELWIGFNDLRTEMLFEWSDHSSVPFALWDVNEPSHSATLKEDCVLMRGQEGKWADQVCHNKYGYICKKKTHSNPSTNDTVVASPGCKPGWTRFGYYCYLAASETKTFDVAKQMCEKTGSYLADITNRIENAFLVSLIGARPEKHFWIGLSNRDNRHIFKWTNNKKVPFTHFNAGMPGGKQGCVAMTTGVLAGLWDVLNCTNQEKYICKQKAEGVITTPAPPTTPAVSCSDGWHPLTNRDYCFKLFPARRSGEKTWSEALDFCREIGGDLLSIHSANDMNVHDFEFSQPAWIGYSIQDPSVGYTWSDGSSSSYENWEEGEPNNLNDVEKCVTMRYRWWRRGEGQWNDLQCESKTAWYCEIQKGVTPKEVEITEKEYNKTEDGWLIFKDNQYYVPKGSYFSMEEGRSFCKHRHGDLVVINDEEERVFLWHQLLMGYTDAYIGMTVDLDKSVLWMDGSPVVFQRWSENQPAFLNNEERCVKMTRSQGLWESVNCGDSEKFICKRSGSVPVNTTAAPTEPPKGGCAPDWVKFQEKCYKVQLEPKPWIKARSYCRDVGGDLASISNALQQAFLTLKMVDDNTPDLWLGFSSLAGRRFKWTDGSPVTFTNWPKGASGYFSEESMCVAMGGRQRAQLGKWEKKDCNDTNSGFICSRALDHLIMPSPTEVPKTFKLENSSYTLIQKNLTWSETQSLCKLEGANLASIRDILTQSYIELQAHKLGQPLWIGLNSIETDGYFLWIDNWQLNMERWAEDEPKKGLPCVYVDVDGKWKTAQCNQTYYGLCKKSTEIAPPPPEQYPGTCPEQTEAEPAMTWLPFRGHCYAFVTSSYSWIMASDICNRRGASLVSIQDPKEAAFIENYISFIGNFQSNFWIGLYKTFMGHWKWLDDSVVDYTNWEESGDQSEDLDHYYYFFPHEGDCALISSRTKQWRKHHCRYNEAMFICKTAKVTLLSPTVGTNHTEVAESHRAYAAGVSVVVVIVVLSVLAGLAYIYHRTSNRQIVLPSLVNPMYYTTTSPISEEKGTKSLVDNMDE